MTKLEWCKSNAPEALKDCPDDELLSLMESSYERFCNDKDTVDASEFESVEYNLNDVNNHLDYMVLELTRVFGSSLVFKGGYMLTKLMSNTARQTTDIDFSIMSSEIYEDIKIQLTIIAEHFKNLGIVDKYILKETIKPRMSGGITMYDNTGRILLGVDVGWHDVSYGTINRNIDICSVNSFEVERMLADKITAILSKKRFRRPKDLYDLYCISECMNFDAHKVNDYILRRTNGLGAEWENYPFSTNVLLEYEKCYNKMSLRSIYKDATLTRPAFATVMERFSTIVECVKDKTYLRHWDCKQRCFIIGVH